MKAKTSQNYPAAGSESDHDDSDDGSDIDEVDQMDVDTQELMCQHCHIYKLCQSLRHGNSVLEVAVFENVGKKTFTVCS